MAQPTGRTIDITPTWTGILPALLAIVRNGETVEAQKTAEEELRNMARLADRYVALAGHDALIAALVPVIKERIGAVSPRDEAALRDALSTLVPR